MDFSEEFRTHAIDIIIQLLMKALSPELMRMLADSLLDIVEKAVKDSDSGMDDKLALPICSMIRTVFRIKDE